MYLSHWSSLRATEQVDRIKGVESKEGMSRQTWSSVQSQGRPPMKSLLGVSGTTVLTTLSELRSMVGSGSVGPRPIVTFTL